MLNNTTNTVQQNNENLFVVFEKFNTVILAKISNPQGKKTFAYGEDKKSAEKNAIANYNRKYHETFQNL